MKLENQVVSLELSKKMMKEPTPSANDHKEYNRGVREGFQLLRNQIVSHKQQELLQAKELLK